MDPAVVMAAVVREVDIAVHVGRLGSFPRTGSSYAVPGAFIERSATPLTLLVNRPSPMSQSAVAASCPRARCLTRDPKTSETDSLRAPDCPRYTRPAVYWVRPCVSS